ncbi:MAG: DNA-binding protein AraC-type [Bacillota bacterium]|jgi:AraC-like DNA-binding protein|nr:DNA-binding protein AraC-type [Bacillota bacterium]
MLERTQEEFINRIAADGTMEFSRSIIEGVEIKLCRNDPHIYKHHVHNEMSLGYILEGSTELTLNDRTIRYQAGDGVLIPPLMTHRCAPNDIKHWAYIMLFIDPDYYGDVVRFHQARKLKLDEIEKLKGFIEQLLFEENGNALETILIELLLAFAEIDNTDTTAEGTDEKISAIHDYLIDHVREAVSLEELEQLSGLNKFAIIRNFKKIYVATPAAYHLQYRVAEAKRLLKEGVDVFDICEELKFYDQAHLIREFKKMYGVTPGSYLGQLND